MINEADRWRGRNVWCPGAGRLERRHDTDKPKREGLQNKYLPIDKTGANLFFQLIAKRHEHYSSDSGYNAIVADLIKDMRK